MANETRITDVSDLVAAEVLSSTVLEERRPYNVMRPFFFYEDAAGKASNVMSFTAVGDPGAATASLTEGTGASNTAMSSASADATLATNGQMATITDELKLSSVTDAYSLFGAVLIRSVEERFQTDACALLDDFSNTTNTAGVDVTYATLIEATSQLAGRDVVGDLVGVLDPAEIQEVRQDLGTSGAAAFGNPSFDLDALNVSTSAAVGMLAGAMWFQTSLVTSTGGAVFAPSRALAAYQGWGIRLETERDASMPGTEFVATERIGLVEREDASGETILS